MISTPVQPKKQSCYTVVYFAPSSSSSSSSSASVTVIIIIVVVVVVVALIVIVAYIFYRNGKCYTSQVPSQSQEPATQTLAEAQLVNAVVPETATVEQPPNSATFNAPSKIPVASPTPSSNFWDMLSFYPTGASNPIDTREVDTGLADADNVEAGALPGNADDRRARAPVAPPVPVAPAGDSADQDQLPRSTPNLWDFNLFSPIVAATALSPAAGQSNSATNAAEDNIRQLVRTELRNVLREELRAEAGAPPTVVDPIPSPTTNKKAVPKKNG
jgi:hypothetical protein